MGLISILCVSHHAKQDRPMKTIQLTFCSVPQLMSTDYTLWLMSTDLNLPYTYSLLENIVFVITLISPALAL